MDLEKQLIIEKKWKRKVKRDFKAYLKLLCNGNGKLKSHTADFITLFLLYDSLLSFDLTNLEVVKEYMKSENLFSHFIVWWKSIINDVVKRDLKTK